MSQAMLIPAPKKLMTVDEFVDFCALPENYDRSFELIQGEVVELPNPNVIHGILCGNISAELVLYARRQRKGFVATNDSGVVLERDPDTVRGPDVAYFESVTNYRELRPRPSEIPPVLAVEVLSPSDSFRKVNNKIKKFLTAGVKVVWLVDPEEQSISIYRLDGSWKVIAADQLLLGDPELPGFSYRVSDFFLLPGELAEATPT